MGFRATVVVKGLAFSQIEANLGFNLRRLTHVIGVVLVVAGLLGVLEATSDVMECVRSSPRLSSLYQRVMKVASKPIVFDSRIDLPGNGGVTQYFADKITISVAAHYQRDELQQVLAHEFGHVLLHEKGYSSVYQVHFDSATGTLVQVIGRKLVSCYLDERIDHDNKLVGFKPELVNDIIPKRDATATMFDIEQGRAPSPELWDRYMGMSFYCESLTPHTYDQGKLMARFASYPTIRATFLKLKKLPHRLCASPMQCFEDTKRLRDNAGFSGVVEIENPKTKQLE